MTYLKKLWYWLFRCECGGRIVFDGYKDRCENYCEKKK